MPAQPPMTKKEYLAELAKIRKTYDETKTWSHDPVALGVYARSCTELDKRRDESGK